MKEWRQHYTPHSVVALFLIQSRISGHQLNKCQMVGLDDSDFNRRFQVLIAIRMCHDSKTSFRSRPLLGLGLNNNHPEKIVNDSV